MPVSEHDDGRVWLAFATDTTASALVIRDADEAAYMEHKQYRVEGPFLSTPLDDPAAMARATEALQVSADMPHNQRAAYIIGAALDPMWGGQDAG